MKAVALACEVRLDSTPVQIAEGLVSLANKLDVPVSALLNGTQIMVFPGVSSEELEAWKRSLEIFEGTALPAKPEKIFWGKDKRGMWKS